MQLNGKFHGGPNIRFFVVGTSKDDPKFQVGKPDLSPVIVRLKKYDGVVKSYEETGILISLHTTAKYFYSNISQKSSLNRDKLIISYIDAKKDLVRLPIDTPKTLGEHGVIPGSLVIYEEDLGKLPNHADLGKLNPSVAPGPSGGQNMTPRTDIGICPIIDYDAEMAAATAASIESYRFEYDGELPRSDSNSGDGITRGAKSNYDALLKLMQEKDTKQTKDQLEEEFAKQLADSHKVLAQERMKPKQKTARNILRELLRIEQTLPPIVPISIVPEAKNTTTANAIPTSSKPDPIHN